MDVTMMHWVVCLAIVTNHLQLVSPGNVTLPPTEVMPSTEYYVETLTEITERVDVTAESDDVKGNTLSEDGATNELSVPSTAMHVDYDRRSATDVTNKTLGTTPLPRIQGTDYYTGIVNETSAAKQNDTSKQTKAENSTMKLLTVQAVTSTTRVSDIKEPTSPAGEEGLATALKSANPTIFPNTVLNEKIKETSQAPNPVNLYANLSATNVSKSRTLTDELPTTSVSLISEKNLTTATGRNVSAVSNITSNSPVPPDRLLTTPHLPETTPSSQVHSTERATSFGSTIEGKASGPSTTTELHQAAAALPTPAHTHQATETITTDNPEDDEGEQEEEDGIHEETDYERSLRTRRVINHAALWITIGFVVVLVSYITVLVIYNRTRPDWQEPLRPYSRFENEPDDFPEYNDNRTDCENQELIQESPQHESRRDFSQCVDPRDFPPCEGSHEFLLYEDQTYMDNETCTDFRYRDQC